MFRKRRNYFLPLLNAIFYSYESILHFPCHAQWVWDLHKKLLIKVIVWATFHLNNWKFFFWLIIIPSSSFNCHDIRWQHDFLCKIKQLNSELSKLPISIARIVVSMDNLIKQFSMVFRNCYFPRQKSYTNHNPRAVSICIFISLECAKLLPRSEIEFKSIYCLHNNQI